MDMLGEFVKSADFKSEKHAPVVEIPTTIKAGESFEVKASIGKEIAHPNTTEHHISWIALHFLPEGAKTSVEIGRYEFNAHAQSAAGANEGPVLSDSSIVASVTLKTGGTLFATSYCNIHGLWETSAVVALS